jgi:hypothetical protein
MLDYDVSNGYGYGGTQQFGNSNPYAYNNPKHIDLDKVEHITADDFGLTVNGVKKYFFGIRIIDPDTGEELPDSSWKEFINKSIALVEHRLGIVILPRPVVKEMHDYSESEFYTNNYIQTFYRPIIQVQESSLMFNNQTMISYPASMWKVYHLTGELKTYPADLMNAGGALGSGSTPTALGLSGAPIWSQIGLGSGNDAPQLCSISYIAGMLPPARENVAKPWEMPEDLKNLIAKYALKEAFEIWGDLILKPGQASTHISADGLSQGVDTTLSSMYTGATARLDLVKKTIDELFEALSNYYGSYNLIGI